MAPEHDALTAAPEGFTLRSEAYQEPHAGPASCNGCTPPDLWNLILGTTEDAAA